MKLEVTDQQDQKKRLEFEIPQDIVTNELRKIYQQISSSAKIKGFRPGKVPKTILKRFYWSQIESEVIKNLVPDYYRQAIDEAALEPIGEPKFDDLLVEEGKPLIVGVTLEIKPVLEPKDYTNIDVQWQTPQVTDQDVADTLKRLQEKNAQFEVVDQRPAREGDIVVLAYDGTVEGQSLEKGDHEDIQVEISGENDFVKALIGLEKGETKRIDMRLPEDYPQEALRGKKAVLDVTIKEIKEKTLPSLDDEFARDLGEYDNLESLKKEIREQIQSSLDRQAENLARQELIKTLVDRNPFEPPESMVEARLDEIIENLEHQLRLGGNQFDTKEWDRNKVREELRSKAKTDVHLALIQEGIARKEELVVPEEEIDRQIEILSLQTKQDFTELKERAKKNGTWDRLRESLLLDKAMDFVLEKANRIEVPEGADKNNKGANMTEASGS